MYSIISRQACRSFWAIAQMILLGLLVETNRGYSDEPSLTEYHVKALFLLNFTKYVDWPTGSFVDSSSAIIIGLYGEDKISDALKKVAEGKTFSGRQINLQPIEKDDDVGKCHILFINDSEKKHLREILGKIKGLAVLTVGESDRFMEQGGVINFVKKDGKIRLEINLSAARQAKLEISSRLLGVADVVKGKLE